MLPSSLALWLLLRQSKGMCAWSCCCMSCLAKCLRFPEHKFIACTTHSSVCSLMPCACSLLVSSISLQRSWAFSWCPSLHRGQQIDPSLRQVNWHVSCYGLKLLIPYHIKLWRDVSSLNVGDHANQWWMLIRKPENMPVHALGRHLGIFLPSWSFASRT